MGQAALGSVLAVSVFTNIILVILVVVLLVKVKGSAIQSPPPSSESKEKEERAGDADIEMKPNSLYSLTSESIVTKPNEEYGMTDTAEPMQSEAYEYVSPLLFKTQDSTY